MELIGIIKELINNSYGFIEADKVMYYFDRSDLIYNFELHVGLKVIFKPMIINKINKAILIEKING